MTRLLRIGCVLGIASMAIAVAAPPAGAKVLPYELEVLGTGHVVRQRVTVVMHPHPQNVLPPSFGFEVRWAKVRAPRTVARVAAGRGRPVRMVQVAPDEYRGTFRPKMPGLFVVFSRTGNPVNETDGYPAPIRVTVQSR